MIKKKGISGIVIAKNEALKISACLKSMRDICDEILVFDSGSMDDTVEIALSAGAIVHQIEWKGYADTKNEAHAFAAYDYVLSLDADERLSPEALSSIKNIDHLSGAYQFNRLNFYRGKPVRFCNWYPDKKIRLFPSNAYWKGEVHESLILPPDTQIIPLKGDILHYTLDTLKQHRETIEKYARLSAGKVVGNWWGRPQLSYITMFLKRYFWQLGILEGINGLYISHFSALSRYLKYKYAQEQN